MKTRRKSLQSGGEGLIHPNVWMLCLILISISLWLPITYRDGKIHPPYIVLCWNNFRFGFLDFLILAPLTEQGTTESEANLLLSTLSIVINECKWYVTSSYPRYINNHIFCLSSPVPGFVPVGERWKGNYLGYMRDSAIHMRISSRLSQSVPAYLRQETLHGLISLYYRQLGMNHYDLDVASSLKDFILSVRYTHEVLVFFLLFWV